MRRKFSRVLNKEKGREKKTFKALHALYDDLT